MAKTKKKAGEINSSSMADIAFLLLIFFLVTTTMDVDMGMRRTLPPAANEEQEVKDDDIQLRERNVLIVNVSKTGKIMVGSAARKAEYEPQDLERGADGHSRLSKETLDFLMLPEKSEKESIEIEPGKFYNLSKGIVSLMADKETKYSTYLQVQDELTHAFNCYRNEVSQDPKVYGKSYDELEDEQKEIMRKKVPPRISEAVPNDQTQK